MKCDVLIIGAGPAGLRCAEKLAEHGVKVVLLEKQGSIGKKVCAGGITLNGLINKIPAPLIQRSFTEQTVSTRFQSITITSEKPLVATLNRQEFGHYMAERALQKGAELITGIRINHLDRSKVLFTKDSNEFSVSCDLLVGADGSNSMVRSYLGLQTGSMGIGLHYVLPQALPDMVWNFDAKRFANGYSWIFPHRQCSSVGAFTDSRVMGGLKLKDSLDGWLQSLGLSSQNKRIQAANVNCDFRGWRHDRVFLVGDAAGLASPLTGEGIFPAILSAETVASVIVDQNFVPSRLQELIKKHHSHKIMQKLAGKSPIIALFLAELSAFMLKHRMISFDKFEMA